MSAYVFNYLFKQEICIYGQLHYNFRDCKKSKDIKSDTLEIKKGE